MIEFVNTLLVDQAYEAIKEDVLHKRLMPGEKINVREISERYNISGTTIKQALNRLMSEGMVDSIPHRGMIVRALSQKDLFESLEARRMIETYSVPFAIRLAKRDDSFLNKLMDNLSRHSESILEADRSDNYLKQNTVDFEFHQMFVLSIDNACITNMYNNIGTHMTLFYLYGHNSTARFKECLKEHQAIYDALKSGDENLLTESINNHINLVHQDYSANIPVALQ